MDTTVGIYLLSVLNALKVSIAQEDKFLIVLMKNIVLKNHQPLKHALQVIFVISQI